MKTAERWAQYRNKVEQRYRQSMLLDELFDQAIEAYIFLNATRLLIPGLRNWSTVDGNGGQVIDQAEYDQVERPFLETMVKFLDSKPNRSIKFYFIHLVMLLSDVVGYQFSAKAKVVIEANKLDQLVGHPLFG